MPGCRLNCSSPISLSSEMDSRLTERLKQLRKMSSSDAADWLMREMPRDSPGLDDALTLIGGISWESADQLKLAKHYLTGPVFAGNRPYRTFASFMKAANLIRILEESIPTDDRRRSLLKDHLSPILSQLAKNYDDRDFVKAFLGRL